MIILGTNSIKDTGYDVANSLRFNDGSSDNLSDSQSTGNRRTWTFSTWVKRCTIGSSQVLINARTSDEDRIQFHSSNVIRVYFNGSSSAFLVTNRLFRDVSAWYHIVVAVDTTQGTASNRIKLYVNGVQETLFSTENYPSQNYDTFFNVSNTLNIGTAYGGGEYMDGYMAEMVLIDGQQLAPTSFGEFDEDSGIWKPIDVSGLTFGTNGFYLDFENSGALGADVSGNSNNFTVNNLTAIDQSTDTCTNNFALWNSLINTNGVVYSEGNLKADLNGNQNWTRGVASSYVVSQGKWYWEIKQTSSAGYNINGIIREDDLTWFSGQGGTNLYNRNMIALQSDGTKYANGSGSSSSFTYTTGDIVMFALDMTNQKLYIGKNGTWFNSGNPSSGSGEIFGSSAFTSGYGYNPSFLGYDLGTDPIIEANFGSPPYAISSGNTDPNGYGNFEYAVPSGYYSLNTKNLSEFG